nr:2-succinyl-5-enolpyruvyl-6-hydroxy-3-cyclohexene-1-carboxylic-acid synthase [Kineosporia mesophila]
MVDSLARLGVRHVVLCPGSRSAPLAYALAEAADAGVLDLHVRIDERTAAFLALGLARGGGVPAAVVTTSGTAVANLHPAVLEAAHAGVPLLVLSADRPHELRGTGASQTTDQVKLFGSAVRWFGEIPAPTGHRAGQVAGWRNVASRAVAAARGRLGHTPGPVQLNIGFAEPLTPDEGEPGPWPEPLTDEPAPGLTVIPEPAPPVPFPLELGPRTVVLAGDGAGPEAADLARRVGWPLLAEPSSGVRDSTTAAPYRLLLGTRLGEKIERVVVFGRPTLSRPVTRLLSSSAVEIIVVSPRPDWSDAGRRARIVVPAVTVAGHPAQDETWLGEWLSAAQEAEKAIGAVIDDEERLTGQLVARQIAGATGPDELLFSGSSNPIRDLDLVARIPHGAQLMANRGLAGIDGTISTAIGAALASGRTTRLLLGDLTFLHDANALLLGPGEPRPDLQIVVVDDHGGGIFATLEHGARAERGDAQNRHYERVFGTPQQVDLEALARGYAVAYTRVADATELEARLTSSIIGISLLHVEIDRTRHRELTDRLRRAIG